MLRKRSIGSKSKLAAMADFGSTPQSATEKYLRPSLPFFDSPRLLLSSFTSKGLSDTEMSPTSILEAVPFSPLKTPFSPKSPKLETKTHWEKFDSIGIGVALVDTDGSSGPTSPKPDKKTVLFGSQLRIQIPPSVFPPTDCSTKSPGDFGIKTRNSELGFLSPSLGRRCLFGFGLDDPNSATRVSSGCLSASEMELSEDYTCVISRGPNPKTTHIFDDCIVERCNGVARSAGSRKQSGFVGNQSMSYPPESFLSFCYSCKKNLGEGRDIYMYRGEQAFCSSECRDKEIFKEEQARDSGTKDVCGFGRQDKEIFKEEQARDSGTKVVCGFGP